MLQSRKLCDNLFKEIEKDCAMQAGRLMNIEDARKFILAGNATVTLVSVASGKRFTYKIRQKDNTTPHFVALLNGPDNENDFQYMGAIFKREEFRATAKSKIGKDAPSFQAFDWSFKAIINGETLPEGLEVWHEGKCCRCNRKLTVPESISNGIGPECAQHII